MSLILAQKKKTLKALLFLKEKRDGKLKGRTCADGRKQWVYKTNIETASPTVYIDSVMLIAIVDTTEKRVVAIADVVIAYLNANIDEFLLLKMEEEQVDVLCKINSDYE